MFTVGRELTVVAGMTMSWSKKSYSTKQFQEAA
jgi:hypothetical protein